jgi:hypothetical protein
MIMIPITIVFLIGVFFEKSDYHLKKEADKLPSFTKKEAEGTSTKHLPTALM